MTTPIETINPVIGDLSFVARYGRAPTAGDDPTERVATHLAFAERILRAADVSHPSPGLRSKRAELLDALSAYVRARRFPLPAATSGRLPAFVDACGRRCAVAALVEHDSGEATVRALDDAFHAAFVSQIDAPAFDAWIATSGLTRAELALVQPAYGWEPPPPPVQTIVATTLETAVATGDGHSDMPARGLMELGLRLQPGHNYYIGDAIVALDGAIGADSGSQTPYAVSARIGTEMLWSPGMLFDMCADGCHDQRWGGLAGIRLDGEGSRIPSAWTIPVDAYWYGGQFGNYTHVGLLGGVRFQVAGSDRAVGWSGGVDLVTKAFDGVSPVAPRDLHIGAGVERVSDVVFVGLTLAITSMDRYDAQGRGW
jgi:hypothetical protein